MFQDNSIVEKIRSVSQKCIRPGTGLKFDMNGLKADPLLLSMYAETLRFGVQIYIPRCSPHQPLPVGDATIPAGKMLMINTAVAHTDEDVWNTAGGKHPLDTFWPRRFLIDSADSESGPLRKGSVQFSSSPTKNNLDVRGIQSSEGTFSVEGLDGSWIPFGGKHALAYRKLPYPLNRRSLRFVKTILTYLRRTKRMPRSCFSQTYYVVCYCYDEYYV